MIEQTHAYMPKWITHRNRLEKGRWQRVCGTYHRYGVLLHGGTIALSQSCPYPYGTWVVAYGYWNGHHLESMFVARLSHATDTAKGYTRTHYCAGQFAISLYKSHHDLDVYVKEEVQQSWVYITAENPYSSYTPQNNAQYNASLRQEIMRFGYRFWEGWGIPHCSFWNPEASFLVLGVEEERALIWKERYKQSAIVFGQIYGKADLR